MVLPARLRRECSGQASSQLRLNRNYCGIGQELLEVRTGCSSLRPAGPGLRCPLSRRRGAEVTASRTQTCSLLSSQRSSGQLAGDSIQRQRLNRFSALEDLFFLTEGTWVAGRGAGAEKRRETFAPHLPLSPFCSGCQSAVCSLAFPPSGCAFLPTKAALGQRQLVGDVPRAPTALFVSASVPRAWVL